MPPPGPFPFLALFAVMLLSALSLMGFLSGWYSLARRYPGKGSEPPVLRLEAQSGILGNHIGFNRILTLEACPSGLRVAARWPFGLLFRPFQVPWERIRARRRTYLFRHTVELSFGAPEEGRLIIAAGIADRIARAVPGSWPEQGTG